MIEYPVRVVFGKAHRFEDAAGRVLGDEQIAHALNDRISYRPSPVEQRLDDLESQMRFVCLELRIDPQPIGQWVRECGTGRRLES